MMQTQAYGDIEKTGWYPCHPCTCDDDDDATHPNVVTGTQTCCNSQKRMKEQQGSGKFLFSSQA
jgi:hypothetical protein